MRILFACSDHRLTSVIAIAALLVGSTFMVVTMIGLQEARARAPSNPTALLGQMTTGFPISPLTPATFLVVGLTGIELGEHICTPTAGGPYTERVETRRVERARSERRRWSSTDELGDPLASRRRS